MAVLMDTSTSRHGFLGAKEWLLVIFTLPFLLFGLRIIYNLYFHRLSKFPGPKLFAATRLPYTYYNIVGRLPFAVKELHDKYGPVVRIAPNDLSFISAAAWRDIYGFRAGKPNFPKDRYSYGVRDPSMPDGIILANDEMHARIRRQMSHAFSQRALQEQEPLVTTYIDLMMKQLRVKCAEGSPQDMMAWYNWTTFDIIGDLALGESFGCLENMRWHFWVLNILKAIRAGNIAINLNRYGALPIVRLFVPRSFMEKRDKMIEYSRMTVDKRLDYGNEKPDFLSFLARENKDGEAMTRRQLYSNMNILVIAGSETTATLLSGVTYHLLRNPEKLAKLVQEIRTTFPSDDAEHINFNTVSELPYLRACLDEGLRVYPPVASGFGRIVVGEEQTVDGQVIPAGTSCCILQWACSRSESNWSQANDYIPERWLSAEVDKTSAERFASDKKDSIQPFSTGPRNCLGKNLAYLEMRLILVRLLWNFDLTLADESNDWMKQRVFIIWEKLPLMVNVTPVKR